MPVPKRKFMPIDTTEPVLEPHTQQFVDGLANAPPIYTLSPDAARWVLVRAQSIPVGKPSARIEDIGFPVLLYPVTDAGFDTASYARFADGPWLTKRAMEWFWDAYSPDPTARKRPTATPLNASLDQLAGLPEALVVVDENDVLRDEGEAYAQKLSNAGVRVTSNRYNGTIHDFVMLNALADTPAARGAIMQAVCALKTSLG